MRLPTIKASYMHLMVFIFSLCAISLVNLGSGVASAKEAAKPKLTILIGVDQFRASYLTEYDQMFTGGFRRMIDQGLWYKKGIVDHAPAESLPGHTTLSTGSNPKRHGITSNSWIAGTPSGEDEQIKATVPHVDFDNPILGSEGSIGYSGYNIDVSTIADWFRAADPNAKAVALSVTPLAVMYGGRPLPTASENHVYWLGGNGRFETSTYYRDEYPDWLEAFNQEMAGNYLDMLVWEDTVPAEFHKLARKDDVPYEYDGIHTAFPHRADEESDLTGDALKNWWLGRFSPYQNDALFDMARESVSQLKLGQRQSADFLSLAIKLTDRVGHDYGPKSREQLDVVHRLDLLLGDFMTFLDTEVGEGNYVIALSADHGAPNITEYEQVNGRQSVRVTSTDIENSLSAVENLIRNYQGPRGDLPGLIARQLEREPFVYKAMTTRDLQEPFSEDPTILAYQNAFRVDRVRTYPLWTQANIYGQRPSRFHPSVFGVVVDLTYQANIWSARSTHGGAHMYDREVPILFYGNSVAQGTPETIAYTRDIAPTLAAISGVALPGAIDGRVLYLH